jgi:glycosyltransferase involved in cell wall biosynthesis
MNTDQMHIRLLIPSLAMGGAESVCVNIANNFVLRGWRVELLVLNLNNAVYTDRLDARVELVSLNVSQARHAIPALIRQLSTPQTMLVFSYELTLLLIAIKTMMQKPVRIIAYNPSTISNNSQNIQGNAKRWLLSRLIRLFYGSSDFIICQSQGIWVDFIHLFPRAKDRTCIVYNPVNSDIEQEAQQLDWSTITKQDYFLCVGRLEVEKGYDDAIRAFAKLHPQHPTLRLKFVGTGSKETELKALATKLNINNHIDFEGFQRNVIPYYLAAKATLLTSHYEGLPNVLIESITLGTPIVAFNCPSGPAEIVIDQQNGYLVNDKDEQHLIDCMRHCLNRNWDPQVVRQTATKFSSNHIMIKYINIISQHYAS